MHQQVPDVLLIGGGIMSATLAVLIHETHPHFTINIVERLPKVAEESSEAWNNAGTGHSGYCELNYTPLDQNGEIDISKAIKIAEDFSHSLEFWNDCADKGILKDLSKCLHAVPHLSFVEGLEDMDYLESRWLKLREHPLFKEMKFSKDSNVIKSWAPLMFDGRQSQPFVAATYMEKGLDVNFGELTDQLFEYLAQQNGINLYLNTEVTNLTKLENGHWLADFRNLEHDFDWQAEAKFVFVGAGGGSLPLLEKSDIEEIKGYGGFPISGQWLRCHNRKIIESHAVKVYGKAKIGAPPMSVPHLDTRIIDGQKELLFGPFAGFSTKFLKNGSYFDMPLSFTFSNIMPMVGAGLHNIALTKYLIEQVTLSMEDRMNLLREFYPNANQDDWELVVAGQRVQVIKHDDEEWGKLEFGTEMIVAKDKTIAGLLGASPGASTSFSVAKTVLDKCFT